MDGPAKQRYVRYYQGLRERAKALRVDPEREAAELERTADQLEAQLPHIFVGDATKKPAPPQTPRPKKPIAKVESRGSYGEDLLRFLADHGPAQISRDILPHLRSIHGDSIQSDPVRKVLKRAHHSPKSLIMRSPEHEAGDGVYMVAKDLMAKRRVYPEVFEEEGPDGSDAEHRQEKKSAFPKVFADANTTRADAGDNGEQPEKEE